MFVYPCFRRVFLAETVYFGWDKHLQDLFIGKPEG